MEAEQSAPEAARFDRVEQMLAERGRDLGRVRVAAGRSGIAVGFPQKPLIHVSWWALAALPMARRLRRRKRRG
jgi:hypothetical protein